MFIVYENMTSIKLVILFFNFTYIIFLKNYKKKRVLHITTDPGSRLKKISFTKYKH